MFKICWCLWYEIIFLSLKKLSCIEEGKYDSPARKEKRYKVLLAAGSPTKGNFHFMTGKASVLQSWCQMCSPLSAARADSQQNFSPGTHLELR